jgi:hypothetical protein
VAIPAICHAPMPHTMPSAAVTQIEAAVVKPLILLVARF